MEIEESKKKKNMAENRGDITDQWLKQTGSLSSPVEIWNTLTHSL